MVEGLVDPAVVRVEVDAACQVDEGGRVLLVGAFFSFGERGIFVETFGFLYIFNILIVYSLISILIDEPVPRPIILACLGWAHTLCPYSEKDHLAGLAALHELAQVNLYFPVVVNFQGLLSEVLLELKRVLVLVTAAGRVSDASLDLRFFVNKIDFWVVLRSLSFIKRVISDTEGDS